jgi:hypothetical protein
MISSKWRINFFKFSHPIKTLGTFDILKMFFKVPPTLWAYFAGLWVTLAS